MQELEVVSYCATRDPKPNATYHLAVETISARDYSWETADTSLRPLECNSIIMVCTGYFVRSLLQ